ncbi:exo-alpha-sialidase [Streptomyces ficellus]|uniref:Exo-alpha-sialidase n=1 Tax=Streptomyces ficellus TaxID=1977088 RepID=A0ABT7Z4E0_9ACTN|nr:exo-alpha-sialidase [Streptomyces ficellus]MDN3294337.1 exo-alpha-sialidase [Streptomyces ficellus]
MASVNTATKTDPSRRPHRRRPAAVGTAAAGALLLAACGGGATTTGGDAPAGGHGPEHAPAVHSHIHGLGIDPDGGGLYVATHEGIFTADASGRPQPVGESKDDFMGFTVAGKGTFLASGHPAPGGDQPGSHGLIKSTDAGKSWKTTSLKGEADFHALDYAKNTIYGYDSSGGLLRVSEDGVTWQDRARLQALDIAVNPADPDLIVATTSEGVARSADGGRTFAPGRLPAMEFVSWASPDALFGVDFTGALSVSADGGATWKKTATVPGGQPQALTAVNARHILAATQNGVYESKDAGKTFTKRLAVADGGH